MGYIHCCAGLRKSKSYSISPEENYLQAQMDYLDRCPVCGHTVLQLTRVDFDNKISIQRKINDKARKLFNKLKNLILYENQPDFKNIKAYSKFYLNYNEYGVKKKCYSNLRSLKIGLFENKELLDNKRFSYPDQLS